MVFVQRSDPFNVDTEGWQGLVTAVKRKLIDFNERVKKKSEKIKNTLLQNKKENFLQNDSVNKLFN